MPAADRRKGEFGSVMIIRPAHLLLTLCLRGGNDRTLWLMAVRSHLGKPEVTWKETHSVTVIVLFRSTKSLRVFVMMHIPCLCLCLCYCSLWFGLVALQPGMESVAVSVWWCHKALSWWLSVGLAERAGFGLAAVSCGAVSWGLWYTNWWLHSLHCRGTNYRDKRLDQSPTPARASANRLAKVKAKLNKPRFHCQTPNKKLVALSRSSPVC